MKSLVVNFLAALLVICLWIIAAPVLFITAGVASFLPYLGGALVAWLPWTYFGLGVTYFPQLPEYWLTIPYLHVFGLILVIRVLRYTFFISRTDKNPVTEALKETIEKRKKTD